ERGPRRRTVLNLGADFNLPEEHWKDLANRIEGIVTGQQPLFTCGQEVERLAELYARKVIAYHGKATVGRSVPGYQRVDIDSLDHEQPRCVGAEHVVYETMKRLGLDGLLTTLGFNKPARDAALGVIAARLVAPSSERATHVWLQTMSAMDELLDADFGALSQDRVYRVSDMLRRRKEKVILYDLTNTFFAATGRYNGKAHFGLSKEKRSDCLLVTLGLVVDADGFLKRSDVFAGNSRQADRCPFFSRPGGKTSYRHGCGHRHGGQPALAAGAGL
nr:hypothetical protein [Syntrophobacterales bacterium]